MLFLIISYDLSADASKNRSDKIIIYNQELLSEVLARNNTIKDLKSSAIFIKNINMGVCDENVNINILESTLYILGTYPKYDKELITTLERVLECISSLGIDIESLFLPFVVTIIPNTNNKTELTAFKLIYNHLFYNYIPTDSRKLGLLEQAMLACNQPIVNYLQDRKYPVNINNFFSPSDYIEFNKSIINTCIKSKGSNQRGQIKGWSRWVAW